MNERSTDVNYGGEATARACERSEDLVSYLYGEAGPEEAREFRLHLNSCATCYDEMKAFGIVRSRVASWRDEALGVNLALTSEAGAAVAPQITRVRRRSAAAALREFFALSPLWLRAGAFASALFVCALAFAAFSNAELRYDGDGFALRTGAGRAEPKQMEVASQDERAREQLSVALREQERLNRELELAKREVEDARRSSAVVAEAPHGHDTQFAQASASPASRAARMRTAPAGTRRERQQIAGYTLREEEDLPRLSDLLSEVR